jgi:hypothetical protein
METRLKTPVCHATYEPNWSIGLRFPAVNGFFFKIEDVKRFNHVA